MMKNSAGKKVAFVTDAAYPYNKGGKEKRLYEIATRLAAEGNEATVYCMKWWTGENEITHDDVKFKAISPYYPLYAGSRRSITEAVLFAVHCFKMLFEDFDVVEVDCVPHFQLFTMKMVCVLKRKRMVAAWHEVWGRKYWLSYLGPMGLFASWVEKASCRMPDLIISVSDRTTAALREITGGNKEIATIPNGLDVDAILKNEPEKSGPDVVFAGRLLPHKNVDVLLRALARLIEKRPSTTLSIVGDGPERKNLEALAHSIGIDKNVSFRGFLADHGSLYALMRASKVFVLPSTREGFGIAALEANACGLPVITIDHPQNATRDLVVNGENGTVVPLDELELAAAIEKELDETSDRKACLEHAERYRWNLIIPKIKKAYSL